MSLRKGPDAAIELLPSHPLVSLRNEPDKDALLRSTHGLRERRTWIANGITNDYASSEQGNKPPQQRSNTRIAKFFLIAAVPIGLACIPIILLSVHASTLSRNLGLSGCLPDGTFALPFTSSIWSTAHFFSIMIPFAPAGSDFRTILSEDLFDWQASGYSYRQVRAIDIAWDVLVGRCGQAALAYIAYRVFSRLIEMLMHQGEVSYDIFSTIAFQNSSISSIWIFLKRAARKAPFPVTRRARWIYLAMGLVSIYVLAFPTLASTMTGYTSIYNASIRTMDFNSTAEPKFTPVWTDCLGMILPVWGRKTYIPEWAAELPEYTQGDDVYFKDPPWNLTTMDYDFIGYYDRYKHIYDECASSNMPLSNCTAAKVPSWLIRQPYAGGVNDANTFNLTAPAPLLGLESWYDGEGDFSHWSCAEKVTFSAAWLYTSLNEVAPQNWTRGFCTADSTYAWGFSFLFSMLVSVLNLIVFLIMTALAAEIYIRSHEARTMTPGILPDAIFMVCQAQQQHGTSIGRWSNRKIKSHIYNGDQGLTLRWEGATKPKIDDDVVNDSESDNEI